MECGKHSCCVQGVNQSDMECDKHSCCVQGVDQNVFIECDKHSCCIQSVNQSVFMECDKRSCCVQGVNQSVYTKCYVANTHEWKFSTKDCKNAVVGFILIVSHSSIFSSYLLVVIGWFSTVQCTVMNNRGYYRYPSILIWILSMQ